LPWGKGYGKNSKKGNNRITEITQENVGPVSRLHGKKKEPRIVAAKRRCPSQHRAAGHPPVDREKRGNHPAKKKESGEPLEEVKNARFLKNLGLGYRRRDRSSGKKRKRSPARHEKRVGRRRVSGGKTQDRRPRQLEKGDSSRSNRALQHRGLGRDTTDTNPPWKSAREKSVRPKELRKTLRQGNLTI